MTYKVTGNQGLTLKQWADRIALDLDGAAAIQSLEDESRWKDWARQFCGISTLPQPLPDPVYFKDWRVWSDAFILALS
jgi:hypothetical protein